MNVALESFHKNPKSNLYQEGGKLEIHTPNGGAIKRYANEKKGAILSLSSLSILSLLFFFALFKHDDNNNNDEKKQRR